MNSKSIQTSKGFGVVEILVVIVVFALIGGGVYLYLQQAKDSSNSNLTNQEQAEIKAACKLEIKDDLLCTVFSNWGADNEEPVTITTTATGEGATTTSTMKMDGKNYHTTSVMEGTSYESIVLGDTMYSKLDGVWYKQVVSSKAEASATTPDVAEPDQITNEVIDEEKINQVEYKKLGTEKCGNITCLKYQINDKESPQEISFLWIDPNKARIMRMQNQSDGTSFDMVYKYGSVEITAPADAKDYSEMFSM